MKCHLYMLLIDGQARRLGPFDVCDEAQARALAHAEMRRDPDLHAVDIWWDHGELFRVQRETTPMSPGAGAAWTRAFGGEPVRPA